MLLTIFSKIFKRVQRLFNKILAPLRSLMFYNSFLENSNREAKLFNPNYKKHSIVLISVFILRENILFLKEWLDHHLNIGVSNFELYIDTEKETNKFHQTFYKDLISVEQAQEIFDEILKEYKDKITILTIDDIPKNLLEKYHKKNREEPFFLQDIALYNGLIKNKNIYDYALLIDIDEFMISRLNLTLEDIIIKLEKNKKTEAIFGQRYFENRFNYIGKKTLEITSSLNKDLMVAYKPLIKIAAFNNKNNSAFPHTNDSICGTYIVNFQDMLFHHYRLNRLNESFLTMNFAANKELLATLKEPCVNNLDALKYLKRT